jgi:hypothetical protein
MGQNNIGETKEFKAMQASMFASVRHECPAGIPRKDDGAPFYKDIVLKLGYICSQYLTNLIEPTLMLIVSTFNPPWQN